MKDTQINLRISSNDMDLIKRTAANYGLTVSKFILAVLIPYCCKAESKFNESDKSKVD